jgi:hypothetical protein
VTVLPFTSPVRSPKQSREPRQPTKRISLSHAQNMMEGLFFARQIGMPLNTHLIIHWGGTLEGDDPDGKLFAKLRYLLDKRFRRKFGMPPAFGFASVTGTSARDSNQRLSIPTCSCTCQADGVRLSGRT